MVISHIEKTADRDGFFYWFRLYVERCWVQGNNTPMRQGLLLRGLEIALEAWVKDSLPYQNAIGPRNNTPSNPSLARGKPGITHTPKKLGGEESASPAELGAGLDKGGLFIGESMHEFQQSVGWQEWLAALSTCTTWTLFSP
jgi:hypothetical protein